MSQGRLTKKTNNNLNNMNSKGGIRLHRIQLYRILKKAADK